MSPTSVKGRMFLVRAFFFIYLCVCVFLFIFSMCMFAYLYIQYYLSLSLSDSVRCAHTDMRTHTFVISVMHTHTFVKNTRTHTCTLCLLFCVYKVCHFVFCVYLFVYGYDKILTVSACTHTQIFPEYLLSLSLSLSLYAYIYICIYIYTFTYIL